jgi:hypothetical protein
MKTMKTKKIFSKKLALELRKRGCRIISTEPNNYKPELDVYIFKDDEWFERTLTDIMGDK